MKAELTEDTWKFADEINEIVYNRIKEITDEFIHIFEIDLGSNKYFTRIYYKINSLKLTVTFWDRGYMGDPNEEKSVYRDENGCWCSDIELTKNDILNPEQWYEKMQKLKAEQDRTRDINERNAKLYDEELRKKEYEKLKEEFEGVKE